jgi:C-terminal processing protease CtpA/Prc
MRKCPRQFFAYCLSVFLMCLLATPRQAAFAQLRARSDTVQPRPANLDLEEGEVGEVPREWFSPKKVGYTVGLTEEKPKSGKLAALLRTVPAPGSAGSDYGNLMQAIDAKPFRGRRVRFKAAVRMEATEPGARAQLWLRVDRGANKPGFFDNMDDRPITSGEWQYYEIVGGVEEDAVVVNIGMILLGKGKAWLDDSSIEDLGKLVVRAEPARPLTARGLENLVAFTRLLGYVRHFHPSDEAAATNWNVFAIEAIGIAEAANNAADLAARLETIFRPVAPTIRVFPTGKRPPLPHDLTPSKNDPSLTVVSWRHRGFGQKRSSVYASERLRQEAPRGTISPNSPDPQKPFITSLGGGVSCLVPLALFADAKGTLPHAASNAESKDNLAEYSGNDRATRLGDVALAWNILQHFYPYFDVVQTDWPRTLRAALSSAAEDRDERAFVNTLRRMMVQLHDGHGGVYHPSNEWGYTAPVIFRWIEGRIVITDVAGASADGLQPGDIVLKVDGKPSVEVLADRVALVSGATPQTRRFFALEQLRDGALDSEIRLDVQTQTGQPRSVLLRRNIERETLAETRPPQIHELRPGIFYVDLDRIKDEDFQTALPQLETAKGIIFDLRGYPKVSPGVISHLIDKPVESARWLIPIVTTPDHAHMVEYDARRWKLDPIAPRLKARIAFLTDARAMSYAETYMGIIEAYKLAEIVGEATAGTNGNVNPFALPGSYQVWWTGMKVLKHDGSQHHGVGIRPTTSVSRTIRGVTEKRDEQLERAVAIVSQ